MSLLLMASWPAHGELVCAVLLIPGRMVLEFLWVPLSGQFPIVMEMQGPCKCGIIGVFDAKHGARREHPQVIKRYFLAYRREVEM